MDDLLLVAVSVLVRVRAWPILWLSQQLTFSINAAYHHGRVHVVVEKLISNVFLEMLNTYHSLFHKPNA